MFATNQGLRYIYMKQISVFYMKNDRAPARCHAVLSYIHFSRGISCEFRQSVSATSELQYKIGSLKMKSRPKITDFNKKEKNVPNKMVQK